MTKDEFYEEISDFDDLIRFCENNDCYHLVEDVKSADDFDEWIWDQLEELRRTWYWYDLRASLNSIDAPSGSYFIPAGELDYNEPDNSDLDEYMDDVLDWGDAVGFWDEEDNDEDYDDDDSDCCWDEVVQEEPSFTSDIEITMLIGVA